MVDNFGATFSFCESRLKLLFLICKMENGKLHIRQVMLWESKQGNSAKVTFINLCSLYGKGRITDQAVRKWFSKFRSGNMPLNDELRMERPFEFDIIPQRQYWSKTYVSQQEI